MNKVALILVILIVAMTVGLGGCINFYPPKTTTPTTTTPTTTTPAATSATTSLTDLNFTLSVPQETWPEKDYDVYSFNIYLRNNQTLHLLCEITQGYQSIWFSFITPSGESIGVKRDGGFQNDICERLEGGCLIVFKPSQYDWGEGYYTMRPHMSQPGEAEVKVQYWVED